MHMAFNQPLNCLSMTIWHLIFFSGIYYLTYFMFLCFFLSFFDYDINTFHKNVHQRYHASGPYLMQFVVSQDQCPYFIAVSKYYNLNAISTYD